MPIPTVAQRSTPTQHPAAHPATDSGKSFAQLRTVLQSDLPRAQASVLLTLLIYARPDLTVRHSEAKLARAGRYTEATIRAALMGLLAAKLLRIIKGHYPGYATEYQIDLTPLLPPQTHNRLRVETDNHVGFDAQIERRLSQTQNYLAPKDIREKKKKNSFTHTHETQMRPEPTPPPDQLTLPADFLTWFHTEDLGLNLDKECDAFLGYCRRHAIVNRSWIGAFKDWLLKAHARRLRGEPTATEPYPGRSLTPQPPPPPASSGAEWEELPNHNPFHAGGCRTHHLRWMACPWPMAPSLDGDLRPEGTP